MNDSPFGRDFTHSRELFVQTARDAGARTESYSYPERGPLGDALSTEVAWIGPSDATNVLVMVSGTHGVEGLTGNLATETGVETLSLDRFTFSAPDPRGLLLGFAAFNGLEMRDGVRRLARALESAR